MKPVTRIEVGSRNTVQEQWKSYADMVLVKNIPTVQERELRLAFYAGVEGLLRIQNAISEPTVSEDAAMKMMEGVYEEVKEFVESIKRGEA